MGRHFRFDCQTAKRHRPCSWRRGGAVFHFPSPQGARGSRPPQKRRGDGAPSGATFSLRIAAGRVLRSTRSPLGAPLATFSVPGAVASGRDKRGGPLLGRPLSGGLPPAFVPAASSPRGAAGRNAGGRLARASRARGCEPRPRAPPLPHFENAFRSAPHGQVRGAWRGNLAEL
jgi:hypothetical protein